MKWKESVLQHGVREGSDSFVCGLDSQDLIPLAYFSVYCYILCSGCRKAPIYIYIYISSRRSGWLCMEYRRIHASSLQLLNCISSAGKSVSWFNQLFPLHWSKLWYPSPTSAIFPLWFVTRVGPRSKITFLFSLFPCCGLRFFFWDRLPHLLWFK